MKRHRKATIRDIDTDAILARVELEKPDMREMWTEPIRGDKPAKSLPDNSPPHIASGAMSSPVEATSHISPLADSYVDDRSTAILPSDDPRTDDSLLACLLRAPTRTPPVQRCIKAQDAHSVSEQRLYEYLWKTGHHETEDTRLVRIGLKELAKHSDLHPVNCRKNLLGLIEKQAVEIAAAHDAKQARATIYRVRSYKLMLRIREQMGLTHIIRTSGVRFVDPQAGRPPAGKDGLRSENLLADKMRPGKLPPGESLPDSSRAGLPLPDEMRSPDSNSLPRSRYRNPDNDFNTPIRKEFEEIEKPTPTTFYERLAKIAPLDRAAVRRIWLGARSLVPDATEEEIAYFLDQWCEVVYRNKRIDNPVGVILSSIRDWFEPQIVQDRRAGKT